jgi:carbonic anhydrase/acetyltransferase-like protein (isoleucine patch superfamily)
MHSKRGLYALGLLAPRVAGDAFIAPGAAIIADVVIAPQCGVWFGAVIRGDNGPVTIGAGTNIQDAALIHSLPGFPATIGELVSIGHHAIVHGCSIADRCLVGMQAVVMDRAAIASHTIIAAGALVPQGKSFPAGVLLKGSPARVARDLTDKEIRSIETNAREYIARRAYYAAALAEI